MEATVKCASCGAEYEYRDEEEQSNITGQIQTQCPYCGSNVKK